MKTQISRQTFQAGKRYSGVYQQQGRMLTDADWNELMDVVKNHLSEAMRDAVGSGAPRDRGLTVADGFALVPGHLYVDGIHAQLPGTAPLSFHAQPDFSQAQALPLSGPGAPAGYVLYADVWERPLSHLEDGNLLDPGLHGADTCTRTRTMLQVKWCPAGTDPEDSSQNPPQGDAPLTLGLWRSTSGADPCDPCAAEVALDTRVGNYLFRVEVHNWRRNADGSAELTLKWSSENGAEQHNTDHLPLAFEQGDWVYEFFNLACEENLGVHLATDFAFSRGQLLTAYPTTPPAGRPWVRRWDGYCVLIRATDGSWSLSEGMDRGVTLATGLGDEAHGHAVVGAALELNLMAMALTLPLGSHVYVAGDFWQAVVREAVHKPGDTLLNAALPQGIDHHYLWLAELNASGQVSALPDDQTRRRFHFPPLSDLWAKDVGYDNEQCGESTAENVQEALDWLCQQRDLRFHNKHLHGWGIVCGLQVECGPDTIPANNEEEAARRQVTVRRGYAIDCEGHDVVLDGADDLDLLTLVEEHDAEHGDDPLLKDGNASLALKIKRGPDGSPEFDIERYEAKKENSWQTLLDGTLLSDVYQDCIKDLVEAVKDELTADPEEAEALVGPTLKRWIALFNLIIQIFNHANGRYVFLSRREHAILKRFYQRLQELLRSKTFCAMFEGDDFPDYPFSETQQNTIFAKDWHTHLRLSPDGKQAYTCGAANLGIHLFGLEKGAMIQAFDMPAGEGARVVDVAPHPEGKLLVAIAILASGDTVVGVADVDGGGKHVWRPVRVICGLRMSSLMFDKEGKHLWMIGKGAGLFAFEMGSLLSDTGRPEPQYAFNACGHASYDLNSGRAVASANSGTALTGVYNQAVGLDLSISGHNLSPQWVRSLIQPVAGAVLSGDDDLLFIPGKTGRPAMLCVVTNPTSAQDPDKHIIVYDLSGQGTPSSTPLSSFAIQKTEARLAWHEPSQRLVVSLADGYRLQLIDPVKGETTTPRHPVQVSPMALACDNSANRVYALNFVSNTISVIPGGELATSQGFLDTLEAYRDQVLASFWGLAGSLAQYLKDCFCHHLLVRCPECGEDDKLYLAAIEVRGNKIYKVCNFAKRKYVKSFPTLGYWLSLIPVAPLLKKAVEKLCCLVFPDLFDNLYTTYQKDSITHMKVAQAGNKVSSAQLKKGIQMFQGADLKTLWAAESKGLNVYKRLAKDGLLNRVEASAVSQPGLERGKVLEVKVDEAQQHLQGQGVRVEEVKTYDRMRDAGKYSAYGAAPLHLQPGAKVTLYEEDGKVLFYTLAEEKGLVDGVTPEVKAEIDSLERRKASLSDLTAVQAEYARVEARRAEMADLGASREELSRMEQQKTQMQQEVSILKSELAGLQAQRSQLADLGALASQLDTARGQLEALRAAREKEQEVVAALEARRLELSTTLAVMRADMDTLANRQDALILEMNKLQPVSSVAGVDAALTKRLNEAGIRTVADLAKADGATLGRLDIDAATAKKLTDAARLRLTVR